MMTTLPNLIAHRGASLYLPENTIPAFALAQTQGALMFECDVQLSQDQVPIIFHDDTMERSTLGQGMVTHLTLKELKVLALKNPANRKLELQNQDPVRIPTLAETLDYCLSHHMKINLELKINSKTETNQLIPQVVTIIRKFPARLQELMLVSSFAWEKLTEFHQAAPEFAIGILVDQVLWRQQKLLGLEYRCRQLNALSINVAVNVISGFNLLKLRRIARLKKLAPYLAVYTVNQPRLAQRLFAAGVDTIFTDDPLLLT